VSICRRNFQIQNILYHIVPGIRENVKVILVSWDDGMKIQHCQQYREIKSYNIIDKI